MSHVQKRNIVTTLVTAAMLTVACGGAIDVEPLSQGAPAAAQADVQRRVPGGNAAAAQIRGGDRSFDLAEWSRLNSLRPAGDVSSLVAEQNRFNALRPTADGDWDQIGAYRPMHADQELNSDE